METRQILLKDIQTSDDNTQARLGVNGQAVEDYRARRELGEMPPPVDLFCDKGPPYFVGDGRHRIESYKLIGIQEIEAKLYKGTAFDALCWSLRTNQRHGLRFRSEDRRHALAKILGHHQSRLLSNQDLADRCRISRTMVATYRQESSDLSSAVQAAMVADASLDQPPRRKAGVQKGSQRKPIAKVPRDVWQNAQDGMGEVVPEELRDFFFDQGLTFAAEHLYQTKLLLKTVAHFNPFVMLEKGLTAIEILDAVIASARVFAVCPQCHGQKCDHCRRAGLVPKWRYEEIKT